MELHPHSTPSSSLAILLRFCHLEQTRKSFCNHLMPPLSSFRGEAGVAELGKKLEQTERTMIPVLLQCHFLLTPPSSNCIPFSASSCYCLHVLSKSGRILEGQNGGSCRRRGYEALHEEIERVFLGLFFFVCVCFVGVFLFVLFFFNNG